MSGARWPGPGRREGPRPRGGEGLRDDAGSGPAPTHWVLTTTELTILSAKVWDFSSHSGHR